MNEGIAEKLSALAKVAATYIGNFDNRSLIIACLMIGVTTVVAFILLKRIIGGFSDGQGVELEAGGDDSADILLRGIEQRISKTLESHKGVVGHLQQDMQEIREALIAFGHRYREKETVDREEMAKMNHELRSIRIILKGIVRESLDRLPPLQPGDKRKSGNFDALFAGQRKGAAVRDEPPETMNG